MLTLRLPPEIEARLSVTFIASRLHLSFTVSIATKVDVWETCGKPEILSPSTLR